MAPRGKHITGQKGSRHEGHDLDDCQRIARQRHRQGGNVLFLDRHCEYVAAAAMTTDMWRHK